MCCALTVKGSIRTLIRRVNCNDLSPLALSMYLMISFNSAVVAGLASARCSIASYSAQILDHGKSIIESQDPPLDVIPLALFAVIIDEFVQERVAVSPGSVDQPLLDLLAVRLNQWEVDRRWLEHDLSDDVVVPIEFLDAKVGR